MKKIVFVLVVLTHNITLNAQNNSKKLETHFEARLSTMFNLNINNVLKDNLIEPFKPMTYGVGYNYFYLPKKIGLYANTSWDMNFSRGGSNSNSLNRLSVSIGPLFKIVDKNSLTLLASPYYSYQALNGRLNFEKQNTNTASALNLKNGNILFLNKQSHNIGLMLTFKFSNDFIFKLNYSYGFTQTPFKTLGGYNDNSIFPNERLQILTFTIVY